ncbi:MAG: hypothetical protein O9313_19760 [Acetobacteraceae bacterium]|nr:hypothetical protein [Acetobacteraceae bacterium]
MPELLTEASLCSWLGAAAPGDRLTYFRGALARSICPQLKLLEDQERLALIRLAERALKLSEGGFAHLVQIRHGFEDYEYLIIARPRLRNGSRNLIAMILGETA